jgi:hypothetical protein
MSFGELLVTRISADISASATPSLGSEMETVLTRGEDSRAGPVQRIEGGKGSPEERSGIAAAQSQPARN